METVLTRAPIGTLGRGASESFQLPVGFRRAFYEGSSVQAKSNVARALLCTLLKIWCARSVIAVGARSRNAKIRFKSLRSNIARAAASL